MKIKGREILNFCIMVSVLAFIAAGMWGCSEKTGDAGKGDGSEKILTVTVYAYCPCAKCNTKKWKGMVSTGERMEDILESGKHICAADPDVISLGSVVTYDGREYIVADTGPDIKGNTINILLDSHKEVNRFGVKKNQTITYR